jgi:hypothetical protein
MDELRPAGRSRGQLGVAQGVEDSVSVDRVFLPLGERIERAVNEQPTGDPAGADVSLADKVYHSLMATINLHRRELVARELREHGVLPRFTRPRHSLDREQVRTDFGDLISGWRANPAFSLGGAVVERARGILNTYLETDGVGEPYCGPLTKFATSYAISQAVDANPNAPDLLGGFEEEEE